MQGVLRLFALQNKRAAQKDSSFSRRQPESNRRSRCCRPTPYRLAMSPCPLFIPIFRSFVKAFLSLKPIGPNTGRSIISSTYSTVVNSTVRVAGSPEPA